MSFVLTVWECPAGAPAPHESHAADALLAQQQAAPEAPSPRISAWADALRERFRHRYEVDPQYIARLEAGGLVFSGKAPDYPIMQILELPRSVHPYFLGTQAHPEFKSRPDNPHPLFRGLVGAAIARHRASELFDVPVDE